MSDASSTGQHTTAPSVGDSRSTVHGHRSTSILPALLDVEGAAEVLGVGVRHVRRLVDQRRIPFVKVGHYVRFDPREIAAWIDDRRVPEGGRRRVPR